MINVQKEVIANIPVLHIAKQDLWEEKLPFVMFVHGYTSAKEHNLHVAYLLAEEGFRVILPDALYHGERSQDGSEEKLNYLFWDIVLNEIKEIDAIKCEMVNRGLVDEQRIGLSGTSMGGIVTFGSLTQYDWIHCAVSLMGTPHLEKLARLHIEQLKQSLSQLPIEEKQIEELFNTLKHFDLTQNLSKLNNRPLYMWHGEQDRLVPYALTKEFYDQTVQQLGEYSTVEFHSDPIAAHKVSRKAVLETKDWFVKHLLK